MKKVYLLFICLVFISSCNDDLVMERNDILSTNNIEISIHDSLLMNKFAQPESPLLLKDG